MPKTTRPPAYGAVCLVLQHLHREGSVTVRSTLDAGVVADEGTARSALEALARHHIAIKEPAHGNRGAVYQANNWVLNVAPAARPGAPAGAAGGAATTPAGRRATPPEGNGSV